jgi:hypothetical protein
LSWLRRDAYGCLYFWLGLVKEYVTFGMTESNEVNPRYYYRREGISGLLVSTCRHQSLTRRNNVIWQYYPSWIYTSSD